MAQGFRFEMTILENGDRASFQIMVEKSGHRVTIWGPATREAGKKRIEALVGAFNLTDAELTMIMDELYRLVPAARPTT